MATTPTAEAPTVRYRVRIDHGRTLLPLCACGWRGQPTPDRIEAWGQGANHERQAHPEQLNAKGIGHAAKAHDTARRRAKASGSPTGTPTPTR